MTISHAVVPMGICQVPQMHAVTQPKSPAGRRAEVKAAASSLSNKSETSYMEESNHLYFKYGYDLRIAKCSFCHKELTMKS